MILKNLYIVGKDKNKYDIRINNITISDTDHSEISEHTKNELAIGFKDCIAFPGLINSHDHLEFNIYPKLGHKHYDDYVEWGDDIHIKDKVLIDSIEDVPVEIRMKYGVMKNLICGVTAAAHHGDYSKILDDSPVSIIRKGTCIHSVRLGGKWKLKINHPFGEDPYVIHAGEGINRESFDEINELLRWNLFKKKLIGIHGIAMNAEQSKNFSALIWCPGSNLFLFGKTADISELKKHTRILFGTDSSLTASRNIFDNLREARGLGLLSDEELFLSVTQTAAEVWGINTCGKISAGNTADIVVGRRKSDDLYDSFYNTDPEDIQLILKNGKIILFDHNLKDALADEIILSDFQKIKVNGRLKFAAYTISGTISHLKSKNLLPDFFTD